MAERLTFHFEGALADAHRMNFYEAARFQYAAARLMVKLAQFRENGNFSKRITEKFNYNIRLLSQDDGSFNINIDDPGQAETDDHFLSISLSDLVAFVSERIIEKIDESALAIAPNASDAPDSIPPVAIERLVKEVMDGRPLTSGLPDQVKELVRRRVAELHRESRLKENSATISRIDFARSQKLIGMSAPLISEMATALRESAETLEVRSSSQRGERSVLFLDRRMAAAIETAVVDEEITPIIGDVTQFNKDNGWGKLKIENGMRTFNFSIPSDLLPSMRQKIIDSMKRDLVFMQTYFVRDRAGEVVRLVAVGILPMPSE